MQYIIKDLDDRAVDARSTLQLIETRWPGAAVVFVICVPIRYIHNFLVRPWGSTTVKYALVGPRPR